MKVSYIKEIIKKEIIELEVDDRATLPSYSLHFSRADRIVDILLVEVHNITRKKLEEHLYTDDENLVTQAVDIFNRTYIIADHIVKNISDKDK